MRTGFIAPRIVEVSIPQEDDSLDVGVLTPTNDLANQLCDFPKVLWNGATKAVISLSNWGSRPLH